ncbi:MULTISPECIES: CheR family methyltransferase [Bacillaceae]|uniref:protein-glutamate O-methyltransferase n=1 Tax=Evansella alkalicola TaxID=745819 RepID=A0ABS6JZD4_9BACI|nr:MULTISPECIES: protein-glutamate O-methyltransferase CheR [Bacillaceae]MBU9723949.1 protein-glutamate O-methyltransferase CheR [Bacillus alkalicola]
MGDYENFIQQIKSKTSIDLSLYKEGQMKRRLTSLRDKRGYKSFSNYFSAMINDQTLFDEFLQRMTINVSEFFRNPKRWEVLEKDILPRLLENKTGKLKVWSAACSTGEEPYTITMLLRKYLDYIHMDILASDLDQVILERAKIGLYGERALKDVPPGYVQKYFEKENAGFKVLEELKRPIRFKQHDLLSSSFETGFDLIVCRNVMIYFTEEAKEQLYMKFCQALKPGGVLFVGSTEQIFHPHKYGLESEETFFYRKMD